MHRAASTADGQVTVVSPKGQIRQAFAELLGVNASKGLLLLLSKDNRETSVRCAVADFSVKDGIMTSNQIVADTGVVLAKGKGTIDLQNERMNLRIDGDSKKPRLVRLFIPITIKGPFMAPKVGLDASGAVAQGGVAAALGALVSPLAAILPFVTGGEAKDADCASLVAEARSDGQPRSRWPRRRRPRRRSRVLPCGEVSAKPTEEEVGCWPDRDPRPQNSPTDRFAIASPRRGRALRRARLPVSFAPSETQCGSCPRL